MSEFELKDDLTFLETFVSLIQILSSFSTPASILSVGVGVVLAHFDESKLAFTLIGMGVMIFGIVQYAQSEQAKSKVCVNRRLIIVEDDVKIVVETNRRQVTQRMTLKARLRVRDYRFKFSWTSSDPGASVACVGQEGNLSHEFSQPTKIAPWQPYTLTFLKPLRRLETREIILQYMMPDPQHDAKPYHGVSYAHVHECKLFRYEVVFAPGVQVKDVHFVESDGRGVAVKRHKIDGDAAVRSFVVKGKPKKGWRYSLEWD